MKRREFLSALSGAAAAGLLPGLASATASDSWQAEFAAALAGNPYLEGWRGTARETLSASNLPIEGKLPAALRGVFYRNGPARHEVGELRYRHWFDGDGMVQSFRFTDRGISHLGRFVRTEKYAAEIEAGRALREAFGTKVPNAQPASSPDSLNAANTSILPHHGELLALWEGGSAHQLAPDTLDTLGTKTWRPDLKGVPFSAHPKVDPNGTLWNFGLDTFNSQLVLYQISRSGDLLKVGVVQAPEMVMVHDFVVTARHMLFLLPPMRFSKDRIAQGASFLDSHEWVDGRAMRVLAIDKNDFTTTQTIELPAGFMFHFGNAWEDASGVIRFDYVRSDDASVMTREFRDLMRGVIAKDLNEAEATFVTLDLNRRTIRQESIKGAVEFPRVDPRVVAERHRRLFLSARTLEIPQRRGWDAARRIDLESGKVDQFGYGPDYLMEEHIMVPDRSRPQEGGGWIIGTALNVRERKTVVSVFDALDLSAGPIARATLPYALPLGFHGNFQAA